MFSRACPRAARLENLHSFLNNGLPPPTTRAIIRTHPPFPRSRPLATYKPRYSYNQKPNASDPSFRKSAVKLFKENPFSMTLATAIILFGMGSLVWVNYIYKSYIVGDFIAFPEVVAGRLRRALYYTNIDLQPKLALKYYRQAIELANGLKMDPFSDPIIGVKIQLAAMLEKAQQWEAAIGVLEILRTENLEWVETKGGEEGMEGRRTSILGKTIGISVKLGELYANEFVQRKEEAEEKLVWAVTAVLKEQRRREVEGVKEGEGEWMSNEEIGAALEALATHYTSQRLHYLAAPLYLQTLSLSPTKSCHTVTLMTNLATSLALQSPPPTPGQPSSSPSAHLAPAKSWAEKALRAADAIQGEERTRECDEGCAVAMVNLGDIARMEGRVEEARERWREGERRSRALGFKEGVQRARSALREEGG